jgi:hypothetical protein
MLLRPRVPKQLYGIDDRMYFGERFRQILGKFFAPNLLSGSCNYEI